MEEPALRVHYRENVAPALKEKMGYENVMQIPKILKVTLNSGVGKADDRKAAAEDVSREMALITGQKPVVTKSKTAISNFKLRAGEPVGVKVTLRGKQMYEFLERLLKVAIPTIRDFRGVSTKSFDGRGNYTLGIQDQTIFPEIELEKVKRSTGFDISIVTDANTDQEARELLALMGMPFRKTAAEEAAEAEASKAA